MPDCVDGICPIDPCPCPHFEDCLKRKKMEAIVKLVDTGEKPDDELLNSNALVKKAYDLINEVAELRCAIREMNKKNDAN
jgi:hypothetical protein